MPGISVYLEVGTKRIFAAAQEWPGWCRSGRDEAAALDALVAYGPRYKDVLGGAGRELQLPNAASDLHVAERLEGSSTTDFGAPGGIPQSDEKAAVDDRDAERLAEIIKACWMRFDKLMHVAEGRPLRKGPRGGGRDRDKIRKHVVDAEAAYLSRLGGDAGSLAKELHARSAATREAFLDAFSRRISGDIPSLGARGAERWPPRYAIRRAAWHILDHAWELEDRIE